MDGRVKPGHDEMMDGRVKPTAVRLDFYGQGA
jgi:hypothetical protein